MRWVILIAPLDETDTVERLELDDSEANVDYGEPGVMIWTEPQALGGYENLRIVPWKRVLDYRKIGREDG